MRTLEAIKSELAAAREELQRVEGPPAEVYSRIVGYYRSVRNWNKGKREEWSERKLYDVEGKKTSVRLQAGDAPCHAEPTAAKLILFVRDRCPACPSAKRAVEGQRFPVDLIDADSKAGLQLAEKYGVMSTPTALFLSSSGAELTRAHDAKAISAAVERFAPEAADSAGAV